MRVQASQNGNVVLDKLEVFEWSTHQLDLICELVLLIRQQFSSQEEVAVEGMVRLQILAHLLTQISHCRPYLHREEQRTTVSHFSSVCHQNDESIVSWIGELDRREILVESTSDDCVVISADSVPSVSAVSEDLSSSQVERMNQLMVIHLILQFADVRVEIAGESVEVRSNVLAATSHRSDIAGAQWRVVLLDLTDLWRNHARNESVIVEGERTPLAFEAD